MLFKWDTACSAAHHLTNINLKYVVQLFQLGDSLYLSKSDVYRSQILTSKDDPAHTERIKIIIMAVDPYRRYSNESEIAS